VNTRARHGHADEIKQQVARSTGLAAQWQAARRIVLWVLWVLWVLGEWVTALFNRMYRLVLSMHDGFLHGGASFHLNEML
jgi:hypothetical protein